MKKKIALFMCSIALLANITLPVLAASTSDLNQQKKEIEEQKSNAEDKQEEVQEEMSAQMKEISSLDESISEIDTQITSLNSQISQLENSIKETQKELEKKQEEHDENQKLMEESLVVMYESGDTTFLDMLFSSKSIVEFISNYYLLSQVTECDKELLDSIEKEEKEIKSAQEKLESQKSELDSAKIEKETKSNLLKTQKSERQVKVNQLSETDKQLQAQIDSYNKQVDKIEAQIQAAIKAAEESARKAAASKGSATGTTGLKFDGSFIWPCSTKIVTSTVKHRWGRLHKGIDIGASYENVYASASGYAYPLENPGGYGHYVMIIHGDGYITLYGHLNYASVSYGQYVKQGQVIAQSGNSGSSKGAHLHFEIRKSTNLSNYFSVTPLNPLDYLPGGYTLAPGASTPS